MLQAAADGEGRAGGPAPRSPRWGHACPQTRGSLMGVGEGGARGRDLDHARTLPLPLPPPLIAGSGEAVASPAGVQGAAPPGRAPHAQRRTLALLLPRLPVERLRRPGPVAVWAQRGARRVVVSVSAEAEAAGLRAGQALADAQAILPGVVLVPEDPAGRCRGAGATGAVVPALHAAGGGRGRGWAAARHHRRGASVRG